MFVPVCVSVLKSKRREQERLLFVAQAKKKQDAYSNMKA